MSKDIFPQVERINVDLSFQEAKAFVLSSCEAKSFFLSYIWLLKLSEN